MVNSHGISMVSTTILSRTWTWIGFGRTYCSNNSCFSLCLFYSIGMRFSHMHFWVKYRVVYISGWAALDVVPLAQWKQRNSTESAILPPALPKSSTPFLSQVCFYIYMNGCNTWKDFQLHWWIQRIKGGSKAGKAYALISLEDSWQHCDRWSGNERIWTAF